MEPHEKAGARRRRVRNPVRVIAPAIAAVSLAISACAAPEADVLADIAPGQDPSSATSDLEATSIPTPADDPAEPEESSVDGSPQLLCSGTDPSPGLELQVDWAEGEVRELVFTSTMTGAGVDPAIDGVVGTTPVTITALESDESGAVLRWQNGSTAFDNPALNEAAAAVPLFEFDFRIGASGEIQQIENIDEAIDALVETLSLASGPGQDQPDPREIFEALGEDALVAALGRDFSIYQFVELSVEEAATVSEPISLPNPITGQEIEAMFTIEHLGIDEDGCEVVRISETFGADALISNLDAVLEEFEDLSETPRSFEDVGFDGALVRATTYQFDHGIDRVRQVEFTESLGIFGAGGVDTRVETRTYTDITDR